LVARGRLHQSPTAAVVAVDVLPRVSPPLFLAGKGFVSGRFRGLHRLAVDVGQEGTNETQEATAPGLVLWPSHHGMHLEDVACALLGAGEVAAGQHRT